MIQARRLLGCCLVLLGLAGCGPASRQETVCRAAVLDVLGVAPDAVRIEDDGKGDRRTVALVVAEAAAGIVHPARCDFAPSGALVGVAVDGTRLSFIRLKMLGIALGVPVQPPAMVLPGGGFRPSWPYFVQQVLNGLVLGAIFALVASGYSVVYGVSGVIQLGYGGLFALGASVVILLFSGIRPVLAPGVLAILGVGIAAGLLMALWGWVIDRGIYRPMRGAGRLAPLVAGIGLAIFLENGLRAAQGARNLWLEPVLPRHRLLFQADGFGVVLGDVQVLVLALALLVALVGGYILAFSRGGRAYRACADDLGMAALLGVRADRVLGWSAAAGAALAALGGLAIVLNYGEADAGMGRTFGFEALTAAILGGFGSLPGAVCGGFILGMIEALWVAYFDAAYRDVVVFSILCAVLVYRPQGLFGRGGEG
jgi:branched-chain amino acid transport system permease protein